MDKTNGSDDIADTFSLFLFLSLSLLSDWVSLFLLWLHLCCFCFCSAAVFVAALVSDIFTEIHKQPYKVKENLIQI